MEPFSVNLMHWVELCSSPQLHSLVLHPTVAPKVPVSAPVIAYLTF